MYNDMGEMRTMEMLASNDFWAFPRTRRPGHILVARVEHKPLGTSRHPPEQSTMDILTSSKWFWCDLARQLFMLTFQYFKSGQKSDH